MWTRRRFLGQSALCVLGATGSALAFPGEGLREAEPNGGAAPDAMPDGSASRGLITADTDAAIGRGLQFLARNQMDDGSLGTGNYGSNVAVTSLAALAFMAGGHLPGRGPYGRFVSRALDFVLRQGERGGPNGQFAGFLHNPLGPHQHGPMYGHGFGTLFLGEVYGMVADPALRRRVGPVLHNAIQIILRAQNREGGWRYKPVPEEADLSVTICQIMALRSARNAGFHVEKSCVDACVRYVRACQSRDGSFVYQLTNRGGFMMNNQAFARTAAGVCALYSAGIYHDRQVESGLEYLRHNRPGSFLRADMHYFYGHYYAVQAMWTAGGTSWAEWYPYIRDELLGRQDPRFGSWSDIICNHYATAMACIILQVPNNYLPILQK
jgi:hypothetical protein